MLCAMCYVLCAMCYVLCAKCNVLCAKCYQTTKMEDNQNGRQTKLKTTKMVDDQNSHALQIMNFFAKLQVLKEDDGA